MSLAGAGATDTDVVGYTVVSADTDAFADDKDQVEASVSAAF
tara:strand:+ start:647 stop:772 length:126 start_codon:yes stop_codon:yes gene_type:complete